MSLYRTWLWRKTSFGILSKNIDPVRRDGNQGMRKQKKKVYTAPQLLNSHYQGVLKVDMPRDGIYWHLLPYPMPVAIDHTPFCWIGMNQHRTAGSHYQLIEASMLSENRLPSPTHLKVTQEKNLKEIIYFKEIIFMFI